ncbi:tripartite tricarboxylate transporter substrate binding protein [Stappia sp. MMSF_3263]|uniref:Bug family tripartite tricarboxylate transporter substrate binding protein n=1 Tax=Stappia sp. MMSF_3263 TaxID=3046693 RepID=UPI00273F026E|nr:tripartite tricarboxylate transporter substrate binding protein [Stappia sp. MMSF_3263]
MDRRSFLIGSTLTAATIPVPTRAAPSAYPAAEATIIVGFAPGGAGDLAARTVSRYAISARDVPVTLDFRPGAGGTIATDQVARATADGSVLSLFSVSPLMVAPHLQKVPYDPLTDLTYVASYAGISIPFFVRSDSPFKTWDDLLHHARANPGGLRWATAAPRGLPHIATEAAFRQEGVSATFVPFGGEADAITALLGGHIEAVAASGYAPHLEAGSIRLLIETGPEPIADQPELPTYRERGYPLAISAAYGLFGPAGLPSNVITWWEKLLTEMTGSAAYDGFLKTLRGHRLFQDSATFTKNVQAGYREIGRQIEMLGLRP